MCNLVKGGLTEDFLKSKGFCFTFACACRKLAGNRWETCFPTPNQSTLLPLNKKRILHKTMFGFVKRRYFAFDNEIQVLYQK